MKIIYKNLNFLFQNMDDFESEYDSICLSGGGSKGIILLGSLYYFYDKKIINFEKIKYYSGTSIGSLICLL